MDIRRFKTTAAHRAAGTLAVMCAYVFAQATAQGDAKSPSSVVHEGDCIIVTTSARPILRWCAASNAYNYDILTWGDHYSFDRKQLESGLLEKAREFLEEACRTGELRHDRASLGLWLSVPDSGFELASPRIGLKLDAGSPSEQNLIFTQAWTGNWLAEWTMTENNMNVLGRTSYEQTAGQSYTGVTPRQIMYSLRRLSGNAADEATQAFLAEFGAVPGPRQSPASRRFLGFVPRFQEEATTKALESDPRLGNFLEWVEPNYRVEANGDRIPLVTLDLESVPSCAP